MSDSDSNSNSDNNLHTRSVSSAEGFNDDDDFEDVDFFDQELMDKYCTEDAYLKKDRLASSLQGAETLFKKDVG